MARHRLAAGEAPGPEAEAADPAAPDRADRDRNPSGPFAMTTFHTPPIAPRAPAAFPLPARAAS